MIRRYVWIFGAVLGAASFGCAGKQGADATMHHHDHVEAHASAGHAAKLAAPPAIHAEHEHLHRELDAALKSGGKTSERAKTVAAVLESHFEHEEAYALPPLGLLTALANDEKLTDEQIRTAIEMSDRLAADYEKMLAEHKQLVVALEQLKAAADEEGKPEQRRFAEALILHAANEEQVLYPATLLIGKYLKLTEDKR